MKVKLKRIIILGVIVIALIFGLIGFNIHRNKDSHIQLPIDYLIVLGAPLVEEEPGLVMLERLGVALEIGQACDCQIIVTGYQDEAIVMKEYLVRRGIDQERIYTEDEATSTFENLILSRDLIDELSDIESIGHRRIGIVTSDFHVARVYMIASRVFHRDDLVQVSGVPSVSTMSYYREYLAFIKSFLLDR